MRKGIKNIWYCMAGKVESKKLEEYENENYYLLWWSDKRYFPYNCLGLSDEENSVSRVDNFVNVNVLHNVTSLRELSYRKSKLCKKRRINMRNYRSPHLQCRPSWVTAHTQFYQVIFNLCHQNTIPLMHCYHLVRNRYFVPFLVFYTESVMLGPRFMPESIFYTQFVMFSPRFVFIANLYSVVGSL